MIPWILSGLAIIGAILNASGKRIGFYVWLVANIGWVIQCTLTSQYGQLPMWIFYSCICVFGLIQWKRKGIG